MPDSIETGKVLGEIRAVQEYQREQFARNDTAHGDIGVVVQEIAQVQALQGATQVRIEETVEKHSRTLYGTNGDVGMLAQTEHNTEDLHAIKRYGRWLILGVLAMIGGVVLEVVLWSLEHQSKIG